LRQNRSVGILESCVYVSERKRERERKSGRKSFIKRKLSSHVLSHAISKQPLLASAVANAS